MAEPDKRRSAGPLLDVGRSGTGLEAAAGKPIVPAAGSGARLETEAGETYVDYVLNHGALLLGHAHPAVTNAVQRQAEKGMIFYPSDRNAQRLGTRIIEAVPCGEDLVFTSTGTEATYLAIRLARADTGRSTILKFAGAYHGWHDAVIQPTPESQRPSAVETTVLDGTIDSAGIPDEAGERTLVAPYNDLSKTTQLVEANADDLAAIIVEPGMKSIQPMNGFLGELRALCDEHDVVLIFDEVMTGFRLAWGGSQAFYGVTPDLATYGKAIGGGLPIAAVCGSADLIGLTDEQNSDRRVFAAGTYRHNSTCAAAGLAALDVLADPGTYRHLREYTMDLRSAIEDVLRDAAVPCTTIGAGPLYNYILTEQSEISRWKDKFTGDRETKRAIDRAMIDRGILTKTGTSRRYVCTEHGDEEFEKTVEAFKGAVESVV